ncbi:ATP-binding cassette domain-containing protein [bacterium]|nr:ATP-binding cassette domain-containing protein [bacterium]
MSRSYGNNQEFTLQTPELTLSDIGYTCLIGQNGSGKSSFGESLAKSSIPDKLVKWYYLPQYLERFLFAENLIEQLAGLFLQNLDRNRLSGLLREMGFPDSNSIMEFPFILMSGGERRRIALVCALYLEPGYLILDEPDISVAAKENVVLLAKINNLRAINTRVILISHNYEFVKGSSDLICLFEGSVDRVGRTQELLSDETFDLYKYGVRFQ